MSRSFRAKCSCILCHRVVDDRNINNHYNSKKCNDYNKPNVCRHCGIDTSHMPANIKGNHVAGCKLNPNRDYNIKTSVESMATPEARNKVKVTKELRYGNANYCNSNAALKTLSLKYGSLHKYYEQRQIKIENTCIDRYGVTSPMQHPDIYKKCFDQIIKNSTKLYYISEQEMAKITESISKILDL